MGDSKEHVATGAPEITRSSEGAGLSTAKGFIAELSAVSRAW